jgi:hypothetical protein
MDNLLEVDLFPNVWCNFSCSGNPHQICGGKGSFFSLFDVGKIFLALVGSEYQTLLVFGLVLCLMATMNGGKKTEF